MKGLIVLAVVLTAACLLCWSASAGTCPCYNDFAVASVAVQPCLPAEFAAHKPAPKIPPACAPVGPCACTPVVLPPACQPACKERRTHPVLRAAGCVLRLPGAVLRGVWECRPGIIFRRR